MLVVFGDVDAEFLPRQINPRAHQVSERAITPPLIPDHHVGRRSRPVAQLNRSLEKVLFNRGQGQARAFTPHGQTIEPIAAKQVVV